MDIQFDPKFDNLHPTDRVRIRNNQLHIETSKPFFLVRFIRWIRGDYNQQAITSKIRQIALGMLNKPAESSLFEWKSFKKNCKKLIPNTNLLADISKKYRELKNPPPPPPPPAPPVFKAPARNPAEANLWRAPARNPAEANQWRAFGRPHVQVAPVKADEDYAPYDPAAYGDPALPTDYDPAQYEVQPQVDVAHQEPVQDAAPAEDVKDVEIDAELKQRWFDALDEDEECEDLPLNSFMDGPFAEVLSTPKGIIEWVCPSMKGKIDEKRTEEGKTSETIDTLLKAIGIETPKACMQLNLEPTLESFQAYFESKQAILISALNFHRFFN